MKQPINQQDQNQNSNSKQRSYHRLFELYYNHNLFQHSNSLKKCIIDIDCRFQNRFIQRNDKVWVQTNLNKMYGNTSDKLEKQLLLKNLFIKNSIQRYQAQFKSLSRQMKCQVSPQDQIFQTQALPKEKRKLFFKPIRKQTFSILIVNSQPSCKQKNIPRKSLSSKNSFRVKQFRNNLDEILNNTRYMEKLQRVKLQSTFTEFYFKKQPNPEFQAIKKIELDIKHLNKLKVMTNIRCNFNISHKNFGESLYLKVQNQNQRFRKLLGVQTLKQTSYKPRSKCQGRDKKLFLNF